MFLMNGTPVGGQAGTHKFSGEIVSLGRALCPLAISGVPKNYIKRPVDSQLLALVYIVMGLSVD